MKSVLAVVAALIATGTPEAAAQLRVPHPHAGGMVAAASADLAQPAAPPAGAQQSWLLGVLPDDLRHRNAVIVGGGALLVMTYGYAKWWDEGLTGEFRSENEGWFGANTRYGGADKLGHAYLTYAGTRLLTRGLEAAGNDPRQSLKLGFWSALGVMTVVEVVDGYSRQWRFSPQDAVANVVGAGLGYLLERNPDLDRLVDLRLHYWPSESGNFDPAGDYSGQTYLVALKASGVPALRRHEALRYFEFVVGYGTRGYESPPGVERNRNIYVGVSLNLSELLGQTVFRGNRERSTAQRGTDLLFEFIQIPGTAAVSRHSM